MSRANLPGIGLDYDGTIADTGSLKAAWIRENLGLDVPPCHTDRSDGVPLIGLEAYERMSRVVYAPVASLATPMVPGALETIAALRPHYRLFLVTARSYKGMAWSKQWLEERGIAPYLDGYLSSGEPQADGTRPAKTTLCHANGITILIDDDVRHLAEETARDFRRILLKPGCDEPLTLPSGVELATSWADVRYSMLGEEQL